GRRMVATGGAKPEAERNPWNGRRFIARPGGAEDCCHGWSGAEGAAQPVGIGRTRLPAPEGRRKRGTGKTRRTSPPPLRGGFSWVPLTTGCARCARSTRGNHPSPLRGGKKIGHRFPRVALAALAPPVATILRPSGADGVRAAS